MDAVKGISFQVKKGEMLACGMIGMSMLIPGIIVWIIAMGVIALKRFDAMVYNH